MKHFLAFSIVFFAFNFFIVAQQNSSIQKSRNVFQPVQQENALTDFDGNSYDTVRIGNQTWMTENLRTSRLRDGKPLLMEAHDYSPASFVWYQNDSAANEKIYGKLYNVVAMRSGKLCPTGWHVPSSVDWYILLKTANGDIYGTGLNPLPSGYYDRMGSGSVFRYQGYKGYYWSSTSLGGSSYNAYDGIVISNDNVAKSFAFSNWDYSSVRCIKDDEDSLVAWYPFQGNAQNESGNENDGIVQGAQLTDDRFNNDSSAYLFKTPGDKILVNDFHMPYGFTIALWVKSDSTSGKHIIFSKNDSLVIRSEGGKYTCEFISATKHLFMQGSSLPNKINPGKFDFVVLTYDINNIRFYVNDFLIETQELSPEMSDNYYPTLSFGVGVENNEPFYGTIDDIRIFNQAIGSADIHRLFYEGDYPSSLPSVHFTVGLVTRSCLNASINCIYSGRSRIIRTGICWDVMPHPDTTDTKWINPDSFNAYPSTSICGLEGGTHYYMRAFQVNNEGIGYSNEVEFTTIPGIHYGSVTDIDGNTYKTIKIGAYTWMAENLKTTRYNNGIEIPINTGVWDNLRSEVYSWYDNNVKYRDILGGYYNYYNLKDICPSRWHVPDNMEYSALPLCDTCYQGTQKDYYLKLKEEGNDLFRFRGTNELGFSALSGGYRQLTGYFASSAGLAYFWKASGKKYTITDCCTLAADDWFFHASSNNGYNIRCVLDPQVTTQDQVIRQYTEFEIPVYISQLPLNQISSWQFELNYSENRIQYLDYTLDGSTFLDGNCQVNQTLNKLSVSWNGQSSGADSGLLIRLKFKALTPDSVLPELSNILINNNETNNLLNGGIIITQPYGDIDASGFVGEADANLDLLYSVGLDPFPAVDTLPWENWRFIAADVDQDSNLTAYDASLILQYAADSIHSLPATGDSQVGNPKAHVTANLEDDFIVLQTDNEFHSLHVEAERNLNHLGWPLFPDTLALSAVNRTSGKFAFALASSTSFPENSILVKIPVSGSFNGPLILNVLADKVMQGIEINILSAINDQGVSEVQIYPNPVTKILSFKNLKGEASLSIYDMQGRIIKTCNITDHLDISDLEEGMYMLQIGFQGRTMFRKIIKQNE